jgi:threonine dehydratase
MIEINEIYNTQERLKTVVTKTQYHESLGLSRLYNAAIFLKREDLQVVRSYKIRGAYNKISQLADSEKKLGVVCASAGNHAQGVAHSCFLLNLQGTIFMPSTTPRQKVKQVEFFGKDNINIILQGDTFDDAYKSAMGFSKDNNIPFIPPFDDKDVIAGQATIGLEILDQTEVAIDYLFIPIGGGGLAAGLVSVFKQLSPKTKLIGVEPTGAPSMKTSLVNGKNTTLENIEKFVDGAAVKRVGELNFEICKDHLDDVILVPEGKVCATLLSLYNEEAMVVEPAGALSIAALDFYKDKIEGKSCCCIVSGSNNDITRTEEIKERALFYEGKKHYFLIQFPQRPGALKDFVNNVLGVNDDITYFQFAKKNNRESGPAVVGIELTNPSDLERIIKQLNRLNFKHEYLNQNSSWFNLFI